MSEAKTMTDNLSSVARSYYRRYNIPEDKINTQMKLIFGHKKIEEKSRVPYYSLDVCIKVKSLDVTTMSRKTLPLDKPEFTGDTIIYYITPSQSCIELDLPLGMKFIHGDDIYVLTTVSLQ